MSELYIMIMDSIDIQPPYARKKRVFIAKHKDRPDSNYIQQRDYNRQGLIERETWKLDNGQEIIDLDDAQYISQKNAQELKMQTLEPFALMKLAKQMDYYGDKGQMCVLIKIKFIIALSLLK